MGRLLNVATAQDPVGAAPAPPSDDTQTVQRQTDNYGAAIVKMLPAEAVTTFVFVNELILANVPDEGGIPQGYGLLCLAAILLIAIGNIFFLRSTFRIGRDQKQDLVWTAVATTIAFLLWTWLIGGVWWTWIGWTDTVYPQVLVAVFTFLAPTIPFVKKNGVTAGETTPEQVVDSAEHEDVVVVGGDTATTAPVTGTFTDPVPISEEDALARE